MKILAMLSLTFCLLISCTNQDSKEESNLPIKNSGQIEVISGEELFSIIDTTYYDSTNVFLGVKFGESKESVERKLRDLFLKNLLSMTEFDDYTFNFQNQDGTSMVGEISAMYFEDKLFLLSFDIDSEDINSKVAWRNGVHYIENTFKNYYYFIDTSSDDWEYNFRNNSISGYVGENRYSVSIYINSNVLFLEYLKKEQNVKGDLD